MAVWLFSNLAVWPIFNWPNDKLFSDGQRLSLAVWSFGRLAVWSIGRLAVWSLGRLAVWSFGLLIVWPFDRLADFGRLADI